MDQETIQWEFLQSTQAFPCFMKGCQKQAVRLRRLPFGDAFVQVCLCRDCSDKSLGTILAGIRPGNGETFYPQDQVAAL